MANRPRTFFTLGILLIILGIGITHVSHRTVQTPAAEPALVPAAAVDQNWQMFSDELVEFRYPAALPTAYIHSVDWPPKVTVSEGAAACAGEMINGQQYCVITTSEGAAGSTYIDYSYAIQKDGKTVTLSFTLREVQCENYDDPERISCEQERNNFDIVGFVGSILETVMLK